MRDRSKSVMVNSRFEKRQLTKKLSIEQEDLEHEKFELSDNEMKDFIKRGKSKKIINEQPTRQQLYFLYKLIVNRSKIQYSLRDTFRYLIGNLNCCCKAAKRSARYKEAAHNVQVFKKGREKLNHDLDIVKVIHRSMANDIFFQTLNNYEQRYLLNFQRKRIIFTSSDSMDENHREHDKTSFNELSKTEN